MPLKFQFQWWSIVFAFKCCGVDHCHATTMHITCFIFRSIQNVDPSVLISIYLSGPNWKVIGQVRVAADEACLADVTRKHEHNGSNWTDWGPFHDHRWSPIEEKEITQHNGWGKRFPFHQCLLAWMKTKSEQVECWKKWHVLHNGMMFWLYHVEKA